MNAKKDNNHIPVILAISSADGVTPIQIKADPSSHFLCTSDGSAGSDLTGNEAERDDNVVTTLLAVSESDGVTPVPLYANNDGELLTKSS